jgi:hypothetical protein
MRTDAELQKLRNHAKKHWLDGWSIKRSARTLELPPLTVSRWRRHWAAGEELRATGRPKGSYLGRNLRCSEKRFSELRNEACRLIENINPPREIRQLIQRHPRHVATAKAIFQHAKALGSDVAVIRRLLDLLATVGDPNERPKKRWSNTKIRHEPETMFDAAREGTFDDRKTLEGLSIRRFGKSM